MSSLFTPLTDIYRYVIRPLVVRRHSMYIVNCTRISSYAVRATHDIGICAFRHPRGSHPPGPDTNLFALDVILSFISAAFPGRQPPLLRDLLNCRLRLATNEHTIAESSGSSRYSPSPGLNIQTEFGA